MEKTDYSRILQKLRDSNAPPAEDDKPMLDGVPRFNTERARSMPARNECVCGGKRLYMDVQLNEYVWCVCGRKDQDDAWELHCLTNCGISPALLETVTFDTWDPALNPECNYAMSVTRQYALGELKAPWVFLFGSPGLGKSHLIISAAGEMAQLGVEVLYYSASNLALDLREAEGRFEAASLIRKLSEIRVLALDDLGSEHATEYSNAAFHTILDKRYLESKQTILSTNEPLSKFPSRLESRLMDMRKVEVLELKGEDARPRLSTDDLD